MHLQLHSLIQLEDQLWSDNLPRFPTPDFFRFNQAITINQYSIRRYLSQGFSVAEKSKLRGFTTETCTFYDKHTIGGKHFTLNCLYYAILQRNCKNNVLILPALTIKSLIRDHLGMSSTDFIATNFSQANARKFNSWLSIALLSISAFLLIACFYSGLQNMVAKWSRDEYSHGYMIPAVALFLIAQRLPQLSSLATLEGFKNQWYGIVVLLSGFCIMVVGELSSLYTLIQYAFLINLTAVFICFAGSNGIRILAIPLTYLIFMIPLPNFLYFNLSSELQLLSSSIGVNIIRLFDISVFLEGNVIDLGNYQLQVVDACSGLRYLFPLISFGFLVSYLFRAPLWKRVLLFLTTIPITVFMNSFRIAVIGITVNYWGISAAEGFIHDFEGWIVFMACLALLTLEMWILHRLGKSKQSLLDCIDLNLPTGLLGHLHNASSRSTGTALVVATLLISASIPVSSMITERAELALSRQSFINLPLIKGEWFGREDQLDAAVIDELDLNDYIMADYQHMDGGTPINFYVAYYNSQRKGASIHSPRACLPGGGWQVIDSQVVSLDAVPTHSQQVLRVNRVIVEKGDTRNLVYYWFQQRGRIITNEFAAKWYIFWDSLTRNRTDGALVRVITNIPDNTDTVAADEHLQKFLTEFNPLLADYIPD